MYLKQEEKKRNFTKKKTKKVKNRKKKSSKQSLNGNAGLTKINGKNLPHFIYILEHGNKFGFYSTHRPQNKKNKRKKMERTKKIFLKKSSMTVLDALNICHWV